MSQAGQPPGIRGLRTRRRRLAILVGASAFAALAAGLVIFRPGPAPYMPGHEAETSQEITRDLARSLPPGAPHVRFADAAAEAGVTFRHFHGKRSTQLPEDMGSGAAWGDYDNDGDPDLFLVNEDGPLTASDAERARSPARAALYRNDGGGRFTEVTEAAGVGARGCGMGAAWGDYDGDGDLDLVVTRFGTIILYRNEGDGTFTDLSGPAGLGSVEGFWTGASWADYDRDGDLDLYITGYVRYRYDEAEAAKTSTQYRAVVPYTLNPSAYPPERNLLFRNDGAVFHEVARRAGVDNPTGRSLSAAWCDFDADGWPDLYVANDVSDNAMYRNLGNGRFEDASHAAWVADYRGAMGLGIGDWDNDGDFDIFITHWIAQENALYDNQRTAVAARGGSLHFLDIADQVGLGQIALDYIGWGTGFFDYDNDGRLDLFVVNGSTFQKEDDPSLLAPMRPLLFWNAGREKGFFEVGAASGASFAVESVGRGAAFADYDADGDLDVVVMVNGGETRLLRNDGGNAQAWSRVVLRGPVSARDKPGHRHRFATSRFATGARVTVTTGDLRQVREVGAGPSYLSQSPPGEVHFGLGAALSVERLDVVWPDGSTQTFRNLPARATITLVEGGEPQVAVAEAGNAPGAGAVAGLERKETARDRRVGDPRKEPVLRFWRIYDEATALRMKGDCQAAARAYEVALGLDPRHEDTLYYLGQCHQDLGHALLARDAYRRLVEVNPQSARGHVALGALLASPDETAPLDLATAESHFRTAHAINREETGPMLRIGEVLIARGDAAQARFWLESALRTNSGNVEAAFLLGYLDWQEGDAAGARAYCRKAAAPAAPIKEVLGEGDRRAPAGPGGQRTTAPPLQAPMGKTLLGAFAAPLRRPATVSGRAEAVGDLDLDHLYTPVRDFLRSLARRRPPPAR